jgi:hypothetical protein
VEVDSITTSNRENFGQGMATTPALRTSTTGGDDGISQDADMDTTTGRAESTGTGTSPRAGLGGPSSGTDMSVPPEAGSGMANPADMGDQG